MGGLITIYTTFFEDGTGIDLYRSGTWEDADYFIWFTENGVLTFISIEDGEALAVSYAIIGDSLTIFMDGMMVAMMRRVP